MSLMNEGKNRILADLPKASNAFIQEGDKTYLRFDQMEFERVTENVFRVHYFWQGQRIYTLDGHTLVRGNSLFITGLEGRTECKVL